MEDALNLLSADTTGQAVTATAASTNSFDLKAHRDLGTGTPLYAVFQVTEAFTDAGSDSTVAVTLETDDDLAFGSATVAQTVGTFAALSAVGTTLVAALQPGQIDESYLRAKYTVAGGNLSTGKIVGFITDNIQKWKAYATGNPAFV